MRQLTLSRATMVKIGIGLTLCILVAAVIGIATRPAPAPTYAIDPSQLALTAADVGSDFALLTDSGGLPPAQRTVRPLQYQQQYLRGRQRSFMAQSALSAAGMAEIGDWERQHGFEPTDPPTILGPFVTDHSGIFEIDSAVRSYRTVDAARQEYHCCNYNRESIFHNYQTLSVRLGDEADAFAGVLIELSGVDDAYLTQEYSIEWRHGPIDSSVSIRGAHDITLDQVYRLAQIVDQRITTTLRRHANKSDLSVQEIPDVLPNQPGVLVHAGGSSALSPPVLRPFKAANAYNNCPCSGRLGPRASNSA